MAEILRELGAEGVGIDGLSWPVAGDDVTQAPPQRGPARVFTIAPQEGANALLRAVREQLRRRVVPVFGAAHAALRETLAEERVRRTMLETQQARLVISSLHTSQPDIAGTAEDLQRLVGKQTPSGFFGRIMNFFARL